jgi:hypothetical protein
MPTTAPELELVVSIFSGAYSVPALVGETVLKHYVLPAVTPDL